MERIMMNLVIDGTFLEETRRRNVRQGDLAAALDVNYDQVFTHTSRCVLHDLRNKLKKAKTKARRDQITALIAAVELISLRKCGSHKKDLGSVGTCLAEILLFEEENDRRLNNLTNVWGAGSCRLSVHRRIQQALPHAPILTIDSKGVRRLNVQAIDSKGVRRLNVQDQEDEEEEEEEVAA